MKRRHLKYLSKAGFLHTSRAVLKHMKPARQKIGAAPGTMIYTGHQNHPTEIEFIQFDGKDVEIQKVQNVQDVETRIKEDKVNWVRVTGFDDIATIETVGNTFSIDPLIMEDVVQTETIPKFELHADHIFIVMKQISINREDNKIDLSHFSMILTPQTLITFAETPLDILNTLEERIKNSQSHVRRMPVSFLCYRVMDTIVDYYSMVLEWFTNAIAELEEQMVENPSKRHIHSILLLKKQWLVLRKALVPLREELRSALNTNSEFIQSMGEKYMADIQDHLDGLSQTLEIIHASLDNLMELNHSTISTKMNEVMQVLTVVTTIFIPVTFIAGIYGMNFENMPETRWPNGYYYALGLMLLIGLSMVAYMKNRKWF